MVPIRIIKKPIEYHLARIKATSQYGNVAPQDGHLEIMSPFQNAFARAIPPAVCMLDILADYAENLATMWELGDLSHHFNQLTLENCEPFGIKITLSGHYASVYVVVPTVELFLHTEEKFGEAIGLLVSQICTNCGNSLNAGNVF